MGIAEGSNPNAGMRAGGDPVCGAFVGEQSAYTPPASVLPAPTAVGIASESFGSLAIYFAPPAFPEGARLVRYEVTLESRANSAASWSVILSIPSVVATKITVGNVTAGAQYRCRVRAFGTCGHESPYSEYSNTYTAPEGSLCAGGGCEEGSETFTWFNGDLNNVESLPIPYYGFTGAIPGWLCYNVDILPKTMFEPAADPGEVCIHLKLCPRICPEDAPTHDGGIASGVCRSDSWIESTLTVPEGQLHEFRASVARHPSGEASRLVRLVGQAWAEGEDADPEHSEIDCNTACAYYNLGLVDLPCYGDFGVSDLSAFTPILLPGTVGQLNWRSANGHLKANPDAGADLMRVRFSADGFSHNNCLTFKRHQDVTCPTQPNTPPDQKAFPYDPDKRCEQGCGPWECPCDYDDSNCFGLLVDCFRPCRPGYGCFGQFGRMAPQYLQPGDGSGDYDDYGTRAGVRWRWRNDNNTMDALCDTLQVWVAHPQYPPCGLPMRFDNVPPCSNGEWSYRFYFTENGQEVGKMLCNGAVPPSSMLTLMFEQDMRQASPAGYWWTHQSATIWDNREKWAIVGPVRVSVAGEERWFADSSPDCPYSSGGWNATKALVPVTWYRPYNEDRISICCISPCQQGCSVVNAEILEPPSPPWERAGLVPFGGPSVNFTWKPGYPFALTGCSYFWYNTYRQSPPGLVNGSQYSYCRRVRFKWRLLACTGTELLDITDDAVTVTCATETCYTEDPCSDIGEDPCPQTVCFPEVGNPLHGGGFAALGGCLEGEYCWGNPITTTGWPPQQILCNECSAPSPAGSLDWMPDLECPAPPP